MEDVKERLFLRMRNSITLLGGPHAFDKGSMKIKTLEGSGVVARDRRQQHSELMVTA
jgi:hypothetical protein